MAELLGKIEETIVVIPKLSKKEKTKKLQEELADLKKEVDEIPPVDETILIEKPKKERSEKQKAVLAKANEARKIKIAERKDVKDKQDAEQKKVTERMIIDKAIKLKKKQIRHVKVLEESDSDESIPIKVKPVIVPERKIRFV